MTTFYWTDDQLNRWSEADGITSYAPSGGPGTGGAAAVALFSNDGAGGVLAFGVTELDGVTGWGALGWRTNGDLVETDGLWVPLDSVGEWTLPGGDKIGGYFTTPYDGNGAYYDATTGLAFVTGIFRRYDPDTNIQVEHNMLVVDPAVGVVDSAIESFVNPFLYEPTSLQFRYGGELCVLGRKLYYTGDSSASTIVEFDMDTYATRNAQRCLDQQRTGDMAVRPGDTSGLWLVDEFGYNSPFDVLLRRFEVEDLPWGTSDIPATPSEEIALFRDDFTGPVDTGVNVLGFTSANEVLYQALQVAESNNLTWWRQTINPLGEPELVVALGTGWFDDHTEAYQVWIVPEVEMPNLVGDFVAGDRKFWRPGLS